MLAFLSGCCHRCTRALGPALARYLNPRALLFVLLLSVPLVASCDNLMLMRRGLLANSIEFTRPAYDEKELVYQLLVAEMAMKREDFQLANEYYFPVAMHWDDAALIERSLMAAVQAADWDNVLKLATRLAAVQPSAIYSARALWFAHINLGQMDAALEQLQVIFNSHEDDDAMAVEDIQQLIQTIPPARADLRMPIVRAFSEQFPNNPSVQLMHANFALDAGRADEALSVVDRVLAVQPDNVDAILLRTRVLMALSGREAALNYIVQAAENQPDAPELVLQQMRLLLDAKDYKRADLLLQTIGNRWQKDSDVLMKIGMLGVQAQSYAVAQRYFSLALENGSEDVRAHYYLGRIAELNGDLPTAVMHYLAVKPGQYWWDSQLRALSLLPELDRTDEAHVQLRKLLTYPLVTLQRVSLNLLQVKLLQREGREADARARLDQLLQLFPDNPEILYTHILDLMAQSGDPQLASNMDRLLAWILADPAAMTALSQYVLVQKEGHSQVQKLAEKAQALSPNNPATLHSVGWLQYNLGDYQRALPLLQKAQQLTEFDPNLSAHLAQALWKSGRPDEAKALVKAALKKAPENTELERLQLQYQ